MESLLTSAGGHRDSHNHWISFRGAGQPVRALKRSSQIAHGRIYCILDNRLTHCVNGIKCFSESFWLINLRKGPRDAVVPECLREPFDPVCPRARLRYARNEATIVAAPVVQVAEREPFELCHQAISILVVERHSPMTWRYISAAQREYKAKAGSSLLSFMLGRRRRWWPGGGAVAAGALAALAAGCRSFSGRLGVCNRVPRDARTGLLQPSLGARYSSPPRR